MRRRYAYTRRCCGARTARWTRTTEATFFYLPVWVGALLWHSGWDNVSELQDLIRAAYRYCQYRYPKHAAWKEGGPRNHIMAFTHDVGPILFPDDLPRNQFLTVGSQDTNDIVLPPCCARLLTWRSRELLALSNSSWIAAPKRVDIFFQGARKSGFRGQFVDHYAEWLRNGSWPSSVRTRADCGRECFAQSVFCFTPPGFDGVSWTGRDSGAVLAGCIPVHYNKSWPFDRFIWWSAISLNAGAEDEQALASTPALVADALRNASWVRNAQLGLQQLWPAMTIVPSCVSK